MNGLNNLDILPRVKCFHLVLCWDDIIASIFFELEEDSDDTFNDSLLFSSSDSIL